MGADVEIGVVDPVRPSQAPPWRGQALLQAPNAGEPSCERGLDGRRVHVTFTGNEKYRADVHGYRSDVRDERDQVARAELLATVVDRHSEAASAARDEARRVRTPRSMESERSVRSGVVS